MFEYMTQKKVRSLLTDPLNARDDYLSFCKKLEGKKKVVEHKKIMPLMKV